MDRKPIWKNNGWKLPQNGEEKRHISSGRTERPKQNESPERNITIKILKIKDEERILKAARESKSLCIIESL